ncbi:MAG: transporter substrate-binding domain-containing protein [Deltaproteobacteria bacterium]|nr:transporter substrate-binding domain-containing protein [Deltaproteobacteria bacterium]
MPGSALSRAAATAPYVRRAVVLVWALGLAAGCEPRAPSAAAPVATPTGSAPAAVDRTVGLGAVRARGRLRLLTRNNGISYFVWHGRRLGFDYELAQRFAASLNLSLEVIVPLNWGDLIPTLQAGKADLIAAGLTVTPERDKEVRFAQPYTLTHMRVVWGRGHKRLKDPEDLAGRPVHVRMNSAYYRRLQELNGLFEAARKPAIDVVLESESLETEQILEEVAAGRIPYTLCDYPICMENKSYLQDLVIGPRVSDPQPLAWAVAQGADDLAAEIDRFMDNLRKNGELDVILKRYYETPRRKARDLPRARSRHSGPISPYDAVLRAAAEPHGLDWRLLAAIAVEESGFDPKNEVWNGGVGLFGMLPATGRELGVEDLKNPAEAARAAAIYLQRLGGQFASVSDADERQRLTLASFACGAGHVADARLVATSEKLDPDKWANVARGLRLLSRAETAAKAEHGYVRGGEVVAYVDRVWGTYRAYRHDAGERDR